MRNVHTLTQNFANTRVYIHVFIISYTKDKSFASIRKQYWKEWFVDMTFIYLNNYKKKILVHTRFHAIFQLQFKIYLNDINNKSR